MPLARISLTLSRHFSLSFIASGRSSGLHPVSSHSCMYVRAGCPTFAWPYVGVHRSSSLMSSSLMSSSLLLQQCPACLVRVYICVCVCICIYNKCVCTGAYVFIEYIYMYVCESVKCVYVYRYIYMFACIYIYIYVCVCLSLIFADLIFFLKKLLSVEVTDGKFCS